MLSDPAEDKAGENVARRSQVGRAYETPLSHDNFINLQCATELTWWLHGKFNLNMPLLLSVGASNLFLPLGFLGISICIEAW